MKARLSSYLVLCMVSLFFTCNTTEFGDNYLEKGTPPSVPVTAPFSRGVNFSGWFETENPEAIQFTRYVKEDFANVKSLGADVVRLPVRFHDLTSGEPDYLISPLLLKFLDSAVDWALENELYLIIDNHSFHPINPTPEDVDEILLPVWDQIAQRYKDRSHLIVYEILNEPHGISPVLWGEIQRKAVETIRKHDEDKWIIVGGTDYNSLNQLFNMPVYSDPRLIYTFHFYDPFMFTHQGASWTDPSMAPVAGVPFPAEGKKIPPVPESLRNTWIASALRDYASQATTERIFQTLNSVVDFAYSRNVPVFCGEFGVYLINSPPNDRVIWYRVVTDALNRRNISWTSWDYFGGFGLFNTENGGSFHSDLNVSVVRALGFEPPPQQPVIVEPYKTGFTIFDDYLHRGFSISYWGDGEFSMYDTSPADGEFAIRWVGPGQYHAIGIDFDRRGDFSYLAASGYAMEFKARTNSAVSFDVRFMNPDNSVSTPWRIRYTIDEELLIPDGNWHTIRIPLSDMTEHGAWVSASETWLNPEGKFTWENVRRLEIVAENGPLTNRTIWLDSIRITGP